MATFYFNAAVDNDWATLGNWWADAAFTVPASGLPAAEDDVVVAGVSVTTNTGEFQASVATLVVNDPSSVAPVFSVPITVSGIATFNGEAKNDAQIYGPVTFNDTSSNRFGTPYQMATFNDYSWADVGSLAGESTFNDSSYNESGLLFGDATFNDFSYNSGLSFAPLVTFNDSSHNSATGSLNSSAVFNANSYNSGTVTGNATFNDSSYNSGTVNGTATFNDNSFNIGTVNGTITYNGFTGTNQYGTFLNGKRQFYFYSDSDYEIQNLSNWYKDSAHTISANIFPLSADDVTFDSIVNDSAGWEDGMGDTYSFYNITINDGAFVSCGLNATGLIAFYGSSAMAAGNPVYGNCIFNDYSGLQTTHYGDYFILNDFANAMLASADGDITFNDNSYGYIFSVQNGDVIVNDSAYIEELSMSPNPINVTMNHNSYAKNSNFTGNIILNNNSYMIKTHTNFEYDIQGDVVANHNSFIAGCIINGTATFNDASYVTYSTNDNDFSIIYPIITTTTLGSRTPYPLRYGINNSNILGMI